MVQIEHLQDAPSITELFLDGNKIKNIDENSFQGITTLKTLSLEYENQYCA